MKLSRPKRFYITMLTIFIIFSVATVGFEIWSSVSNLNIKSMINEAEYNLTEQTEETSRLEQMSANYNKAIQYEKYVNTALPDQKDASALISDLNSLAASSGLKLILVQSNSVVKTKTTTANPSKLQTVRGKYSYELPLSLEVVGPYNGYIDFAQKLENYQRLVNITTIDIEKSQDKDVPADQINVKFNLTAYLK
jgi:Tfp pilus assembly protein PilO